MGLYLGDIGQWLAGQWSTVTAVISGGAIWKIIEFLWGEYRRRADKRQTAKEFVDTHLSPLLKAADELHGKLRSLAENDFQDLRFSIDDPKRFALPYLFARFWAQIEIVRQEGLSVSLTQEDRGKRLISFLDCLESHGVRIVDRISQRAVGEITLTGDHGVWPHRSFTSFVLAMETAPETERWIVPLEEIVAQTAYPPARQKLLVYGAVLHAMIDNLDPDHHVTHARPAYPNKLSKKSWKNLRYRVFGTYLTFVKNPEKYFGPKK
jgi:hypothetical protein